MKKIFLVLTLSCIFFSCKDAQTEVEAQQEKTITASKNTFENLQEEAMEAHDAVMPKMGDLMKLKQELSAINTTDSAIDEQKMALQMAHDDMMSWMHSYSEKFPYGFELPADPVIAAQKLEEMKEEHRKIVELKGRTVKAIAQAEDLLDQ
jgi:hypothetical protein